MDKSEIGRNSKPVTMPIERGKIREFARAVKDDNPLYFDEAHAQRVAGGIMPPPTFTMTLAFWDDRTEPLLTYDGSCTASRSSNTWRRSTRAMSSPPSRASPTSTRNRARVVAR